MANFYVQTVFTGLKKLVSLIEQLWFTKSKNSCRFMVQLRFLFKFPKFFIIRPNFWGKFAKIWQIFRHLGVRTGPDPNCRPLRDPPYPPTWALTVLCSKHLVPAPPLPPHCSYRSVYYIILFSELSRLISEVVTLLSGPQRSVACSQGPVLLSSVSTVLRGQ